MKLPAQILSERVDGEHDLKRAALQNSRDSRVY
jgi:hypothetical protein